MPFLLLLFLTLACLEDDWRKWDYLEAPQLSGVLTLGLTACWVSLAALLAHWTRRELAARPEARDRIAQHYGRKRFYHTFGLYLVYTGALYGLGWGPFVQSLAPPGEAKWAITITVRGVGSRFNRHHPGQLCDLQCHL